MRKTEDRAKGPIADGKMQNAKFKMKTQGAQGGKEKAGKRAERQVRRGKEE